MDAFKSTPAKIAYAVIGAGTAGFVGYEASQLLNASAVKDAVQATLTANPSTTPLPTQENAITPTVTVTPTSTLPPTATVDVAGCISTGLGCPPTAGTALSSTETSTPTSTATPLASPLPGSASAIPEITPGTPIVGSTVTPDMLTPTDLIRLQSEPISMNEIKLTHQDIPYIDGQGNAHVNSGNFMEFIRINTGNGPGIIVPKDPHIRARLEWLSIHQPTGDKTGNWQNPGDFKVEATAGDAREYWKVLELWGPGSAVEGEWKTMMFPGQSIEAGANTQLAGSEWSYPAILDAQNNPTAAGWTASDVLADILFSIARRANDTVISPQVQGWINNQPTTGFLTIQDAVNAGWLSPRVPMTPAPSATPTP